MSSDIPRAGGPLPARYRKNAHQNRRTELSFRHIFAVIYRQIPVASAFIEHFSRPARA